MIEKMTKEIVEYLPLKIEEVLWDDTSFHMYGEGWSFLPSVLGVYLSPIRWFVGVTMKIQSIL